MQTRTRPVVPSRADHGEIRRNNLEVVLRHLSWRGPTSRAGIASKTGLTRSTVSRLVSELIGLGLVKETSVDRGGAGRPSTRLELDGRSILAVGMEINVDCLTVLVADIGGREVACERQAYDAARAGPNRSVTAICRMYEQMIEKAHAGSPVRPRITGVAMAIPGLVDAEAGVVEDAPNLGWQRVDLRGLIRAQIADPTLSISVGNDGNFAALAEYWHGACAGTPNMLYVTGEVGIGGGIIVNGDLLLGSLGRAGEIGHMTVDPHGPKCGCGRRGCWEAFIGLDAFLCSIGGRSGGSDTPEETVRAVAARAANNEPAVIEALQQLGYWVGIGVSNLINVFSPDVVVLGGYFASLSSWLLPTAYEVLVEHVLGSSDPRSLLRVSTLGFSAAAAGASIQAADQVLSNPASLNQR
jgi:predicted NBD/HSP70 family sugar kinase